MISFSKFALKNMEPILLESKKFAAPLVPGAQRMDPALLRDHGEKSPQAIAPGLFKPASEKQEADKFKDVLNRTDADPQGARLTSALESIPDAFFMLDSEWCFSFLNREAEQLLGRDRQALLGQNAWHGVGDAVDTTFQRECRRAVAERKVVEFEEFRDPIQRWFSVRALPVEEGLAVYFRDITGQRKQSEEVLKTSEERFRLLSRATDDAIWDWDLRTNSLWWGEGLEQMFGYAPDEVEPTITFWEEHIHREDRVRVLESKNSAIAAGDTRWTDQYRFLCKDGSYSEVSDRGHVIRDSAGVALRMVGGMADISERLALEAQLRQSQRLESVGQLTGGLAHEFNNLLTVILGNAELLEEVLAGDERSRALAEMITSAAQRGAELTQRLLAFARKQPLNPKAVVINDLTAGMEPLLRRTLGEHIQIEFVRGEELWSAMVDPAQLESALLNLCLNSQDAMPQGGRLTIETRNVPLDQGYAGQHSDVQPGPYVMVAVTDTGAGVAPEHLGRVFEPFFTTKETGKGTGLGLAMVYGFVKQSGGHVDFDSKPEEGTTVKLYLPRVMSEQTEVAERAERARAAGGRNNDFAGEMGVGRWSEEATPASTSRNLSERR